MIVSMAFVSDYATIEKTYKLLLSSARKRATRDPLRAVEFYEVDENGFVYKTARSNKWIVGKVTFPQPFPSFAIITYSGSFKGFLQFTPFRSVIRRITTPTDVFDCLVVELASPGEEPIITFWTPINYVAETSRELRLIAEGRA